MPDTERHTTTIRCAAIRCWTHYSGFLALHRQTCEDVTQEAWAIWLDLDANSQARPTSYLDARLIDYVRKLTGYRHHAKCGLRMVDIDPDNPTIPAYGYEMDVETIDVVMRVKAIAEHRGPMAASVFKRKMTGWNQREIGDALGVHESRVSQIYTELIMSARTQLLPTKDRA